MKAKVRVTRIVAERASGEGRAIGHHLPRGVTRSLTYESGRPRRNVAACDEVHVCEMTPRQKRANLFGDAELVAFPDEADAKRFIATHACEPQAWEAIPLAS